MALGDVKIGYGPVYSEQKQAYRPKDLPLDRYRGAMTHYATKGCGANTVPLRFITCRLGPLYARSPTINTTCLPTRNPAPIPFLISFPGNFQGPDQMDAFPSPPPTPPPLRAGITRLRPQPASTMRALVLETAFSTTGPPVLSTSMPGSQVRAESWPAPGSRAAS